MTSLTRFDPNLGRIPNAVAHALFAADTWVETDDIAISTAIRAAAENTRIAWRQDWAVFRAWATGRAAHWMPDEHQRVRLPILPELLVRFVEDMRSGYDGQPARAVATVNRYLSTISTLHRLLECPDPTKIAIVRSSVKAHTRGTGGQDQAAPFRWEQVVDAVRVLTADPDDLKGLRDAALLAVGHNLLTRRAELVAIRGTDVDLLEKGGGLVTVRPTKGQLEAEPEPRYIAEPTAKLVRQWLERSRIVQGPLFPAMRKAKRSEPGPWAPTDRPLSAPEVNIVVKLAAARIAVSQGRFALEEGTDVRRALLEYAADFSGHSLRVGAAQDMAAAGIGTAAIMQAGGWRDERMIRRYLRKLNALEGGIAQLFARNPA